MMASSSPKRASVYEVAELAGISIATVSRALNEPHRVTPATRKKVLDAVAELNYVPDGEAAARARSSHTRIAVVSPVHTYPGFPNRLRGILKEIESLEAEVIVFHVDVDKLKERKQFKYFDSLAASGRYDAIIIMSVPLSDQILDRLSTNKFPTILVETEDSRFPTIQVDHKYGAQLATQHLIDQGYDSIGFLGFENSQRYAFDASSLREQGFRETLLKNGKKINESYIYKSSYGIDGAHEFMLNTWKKGKRPHAIFCAADVNALGILKVAKELGIKVPQDLAIVGFDDIDMASYVGLTTVRNPMEDTGRAAAEMIKALMRKDNISTRKLLLDLELILRETA